MRGIKRTICALCLLALFVAYQASITAFTHVHYVNGVLITHSHPFHNQHSHSTDSLIVIGLLSHFSSDTPDCCELQHPMRPLLQVLKAHPPLPLSTGSRTGWFRFALPLFPLLSDVIVSTLGMLHTNVWYLSYRCLVFDVPTFGIRCTNAWYPLYLPLVLVVPSTGTELVSLSN